MKIWIYMLAFIPSSVLASGTCQDIMVQAYFYPSQPNSPWNTMAATHSDRQFVVANVGNGPGVTIDTNYATELAQAQAANLLVLGYVHTRTVDPNDGTALRPIADVKAEVDKWHELYEPDGIFFDEANTELADLDYYQELVTYVGTVMDHGTKHRGRRAKTRGSSDVVLNHGVHPNEAYAQIETEYGSQLTLVTFEDVYANYVNLSVPAWVYSYPSSLFAHLVYATPTQADMSNAVTISNNANAGYVYVTDDQFSGDPPVLNPWDTLTRFNTALVSKTSCSSHNN